jgi:hypothetical protein
MFCPVCKTGYDPYRTECPSCGPIPILPGRDGWYKPDYSAPGVSERVAAECDYMADDPINKERL